MSFGPFGGITIDGVQFTTDPEPYEPANWPKRHTVHMTIGGGVTIQDFGTWMRDNTLRLASSGTRIMDDSVVKSLHTKYRARGQSYAFSDWLGNAFTVFIKNFKVWPKIKGGMQVGDGAPSVVSLWEYEMDLHVLSIGTLFGDAYTDPA